MFPVFHACAYAGTKPQWLVSFAYVKVPPTEEVSSSKGLLKYYWRQQGNIVGISLALLYRV